VPRGSPFVGGLYNREMAFRLGIDYQPKGDQAAAIEALSARLAGWRPAPGFTGCDPAPAKPSPWRKLSKPACPARVLAHNKDPGRAVCIRNFKSYFPSNAIEYSSAITTIYQPEAYIPAGDVYIEKEATINDELDKLAVSATRSLFERRDCIIIAERQLAFTVSGRPSLLRNAADARKRPKISREEITARLLRPLRTQ